MSLGIKPTCNKGTERPPRCNLGVFRVSVMTIITFATRSIAYFANHVQVAFPADSRRFVRFPMLHIYFLLKIWAKGKICDKIERQSSEWRKKRCFRK